MLQEDDAARALTWQVVSHHDLGGEPPQTDAALLNGIALDRTLAQRVLALMHPGMILTETSSTPRKALGRRFRDRERG